jgi:hypothetical protein
MKQRTRMLIAGTVLAAIAGVSTSAQAIVTRAAAKPLATGSSAHPNGRCPLPIFGPGASYHPKIRPGDFSPRVTNPYFPLRPGRTYVYAGTKDGKAAIDAFAPSKHTKVIDGVRTREVNDRLYLNGVLEERTTDYYAQDRCGNVWYFGEDTATLDKNGQVLSTDGSFRAGVDSAQPGVYMQAHPQLGRLFRQEWSPGNAEDQFKALSKNASITVPYGAFRHTLRTQETTALEPGVVDNKYYVKGLGQVEEVAVKGPLEKLVLVDVLD